MQKVLSFSTSTEFRIWLKKNHDESLGIWLRIWKKSEGAPTLTFAKALDEALCFGWIDSQKKSYDSRSWLQRFTPRKSGSRWSKRNTEHAERLIKSKKMMLPGLREVKAAKSDGRWNDAYDSSTTAKVPADFLKELKKNKKAKHFSRRSTRLTCTQFPIAYRQRKKPKLGKNESKLSSVCWKEAKNSASAW